MLDLFEVLAHEEEEHIETAQEVTESVSPSNLEQALQSNTLMGLGIASVITLFLVTASLLIKNKTERIKTFLFWGIALTVIAATAYLSGSTVYLNVISETGGPVHWHADFEVWACGKELDLADPSGISNRIGSATFHEHGDKRIHAEGVVIDKKDAALGKFFEFVGGELHNDHIDFPTNEGIVSYKNGDKCSDGTTGTLQVFVYKTDIAANTFAQEKVEDFENYVLSPEGTVPPGDCIIIEFEQEKQRTDRVCQTYKVAESTGRIERAKE